MRFCDVISVENLLCAWKKFSKGKRSHSDVAAFELRLEEQIFSLYERLVRGTWTNDPYVRRRIADPKPRLIHVASVRDRILFQAVYQQLYQTFDQTFIHDSFASRESKGTHAGVNRFEVFARKISANYTKPAFVLKCDIKKFFDGIDHRILLFLIEKRITDQKLFELIRQITASFHVVPGKGLPLGNVTSQLFANIYLNELDQFVKHVLKVKYYIRYCDDFVILDTSRTALEMLIEKIQDFLRDRLQLELHPHKVTIRKLTQGTDFLGYVALSHYRVPRTRTKRRMMKRLAALAANIKTPGDFNAALPFISSYLGLISHCKSEKLRETIENWFQKWR